MPEEDKLNANQLPRIFYCRHMQPGICGYEKETVLVDTDAIKNMVATGATKPVYVGHQVVDLTNLQAKADGYVTESFYNELDGWAWFKCIAVSDEAHAAIAKGWAVSNAYKPTEFGAGGTKNNCPYDREILNAYFTHLAIVPDPRYEEACIMSPEEFKTYQENNKRKLDELRNSKTPPEGTKPMFKMFKNEKKEVTSIDADTMIEVEGGEAVSVGEMLNAMKKNKKNDDDDVDMENAMVECDGEKMPLKELVNRYSEMKKNEKKNAEDDADKAKKQKEEDEKKNAEEAEKKKKDDEEKENARKIGDGHFEEMRNAHNKAVEAQPVIHAPASGLARGKQRYGAASK